MFHQRTEHKTEPLLLSPREAAQALRVSEKTLYNYTKSGDIPVVRLGRSVRYSLDDLKDWIEQASEKTREDGQNDT